VYIIRFKITSHILLQWTDWYSIRRSSVEANGGKSILRKAALREVIQAVYPEHPWEPDRFIDAPSEKEGVFKALERAEAALGIQQVSSLLIDLI